jgi:NAD(P)-dependent dehydrogenase (short-subunit alcohol dehydrogenase family)
MHLRRNTANGPGLGPSCKYPPIMLNDRNVRVNAILPSIIDTPLNRRDMPGAEFDRWMAPSDLAEVALFLLSDAARLITGVLLPVTGRVNI